MSEECGECAVHIPVCVCDSGVAVSYNYLRGDLEHKNASIRTKSCQLFTVHALQHCDDGRGVQVVLDVLLAVLVGRGPVVHPQGASARTRKQKRAGPGHPHTSD